MPVYLFKHPDTELIIEEVQRMSDPHIYVDEDGIEWQRVWVAPNASMDSQVDEDSPKQFVNKTKNWSVGEMWDYSKELSEKRKDKRGHDHIGTDHHTKRDKKINDIKKKNRREQAKRKS
jgi:hypothetical protein